MRFYYWSDDNPRMQYLNETLTQPFLFAPAEAVKAATFAWFYSAGPTAIRGMLGR